MSFLLGNLGISYPFLDGADQLAIEAVADAQLVCQVDGPWVIQTLDFQYPAIEDEMQCLITGPGGTVLDATGSNRGATVTAIDSDWTMIEVQDVPRGSHFRLIVQASALPGAPTLVAPTSLVDRAVRSIGQTLTSINGRSGNVRLLFDNHVEFDGRTLDAPEAADRYDCPPDDCSQVFSFGRQAPDNQGSLVIQATPCHRAQPTADAARLILQNFCDPCLKCGEVVQVHDKQMSQAEYYHRLCAIYHDQFNRYQRMVAAANAKAAEVRSRAPVAIDSGSVDLVGRAFNRPYFSQLYLAVVNNTDRPVSIELTVSLPNDISSQLTAVPDAQILQRTLAGGDAMDTFGGWPGTYTINIDPQDAVSFSSELKRSDVSSGAVTSGVWSVQMSVTFGGDSPPLPQTANETYPIELLGSPTTSVDPPSWP